MDLSISISEKRRIGGSSDKRRFEGRLSGGPPQSKDCYIRLHHAQSLCKTNNLNARLDVHLPPRRFGAGASVSAQPEQPSTRAVGRLFFARHVPGCKSFGGIGFARTSLLEFLFAVLEQQFGDDDLATAFVGFLRVSWINKSNGTSQENPNSTPKLVLKNKHSGRTTMSSQVASQVHHE
jgi:hypothetical protein